MDNWEPFYEAFYEEAAITPEALSVKLGISLEEAKIQSDGLKASKVYRNNLYEVSVQSVKSVVPMLWISIKRLDKSPCHDWRHFQRIKNELVGVDCEAMELYPAESRLVDEANQYHLWAVPDKTFRFPVGWNTRLVNYESVGGAKQRGEGL